MFLILFFLFPLLAMAEAKHHHGTHHPSHTAPHTAHEINPFPKYPQHASDCTSMQIFDVGMWMCMPFPQEGMPMKMLMLSGSGFVGYVGQERPRGRDALFGTNMVMADLGTTMGERHYLNLDLVLTSELWTLPERGYPLLLQVGEHNKEGVPFIDAQHPHSSPLMGLTLSDTIRLGSSSDALKIYFSPRGETTDGPVAFMHRPTGMINSDAPLGHHVGQDVGHISSTVFGASLKLSSVRLEISTFNGEEPKPTRVDLPLGPPNSLAVRIMNEISPDFWGMVSTAYFHQPEHDEPSLDHRWRFSGSLYRRFILSDHWELENTFIYGGITDYDQASWLQSFTDEFLFRREASNIWGRIEVLQRTPAQLDISSISDPNRGRWVAAVTLGYTHQIANFDGLSMGLGTSITKNIIPDAFKSSYGSAPITGKVSLQIKGMRMWHFN